MQMYGSSDSSSNHAPRRAGSRSAAMRGFTIIEMLVTVATLGIILSAFANVLLQCRRITTMAHRGIRANHRASVISEIIRRDFRRMTRDGFLCISSNNGHAGVVLCAGDPSRSILGDAKGYGSIIAYGLVQRTGGVAAPIDVLWRPEYIFKTEGTGSPEDLVTRISTNYLTLADVKSSDRFAANTLASGVLARSIIPVAMPPTTITGAADLWKVVTGDITYLSITWTDGSAPVGPEGKPVGGFNWYGIDRDQRLDTYVIRGRNDSWGDQGANATEFASGGGYRALWTARNPHNWPKAIRFVYGIDDEQLPPGHPDAYEVIVDTLP
ncbi:hypothetical protein LCGC14_0181520 [marine sediment metagenome]|uniref:Prepilin-type N-terminal cleavage/methylation domain-containing protein n=1 Tax=marine sediment metagenome TaxID=412755 RepID=A0A0F9UTQ5_9ZZZZ